jgi:hypothetical protein
VAGRCGASWLVNELQTHVSAARMVVGSLTRMGLPRAGMWQCAGQRGCQRLRDLIQLYGLFTSLVLRCSREHCGADAPGTRHVRRSIHEILDPVHVRMCAYGGVMCTATGAF